jgi:protein-S-isoprenylcysteine O-methyltransferase Ste14
MLATAATMWLLDRYLPLPEILGVPWQRIGYVVMIAAVVLDLWGLGLFLRSGTTVHPLRLDNNRALVTEGIYRLTRNPMYLGLLLLLVGFAIRLGSLAPFLVLPLFVSAMNRLQIVHEERFLSERYGKDYDDYRNRVHRWL